MTVQSVRHLARQLDADPRVVRGILIGLGIRVERTPAADLVRAADAARVRKAYARRQVFPAQPAPLATVN